MLIAEQLVGEARERRQRGMSLHERWVNSLSAACFLAVAAAILLLVPDDRPTDLVLIAGLVASYAVVSRVRFEFGSTYVTPEQLIFVPLLLVAPLPYVPLLVVLAAFASQLPDFAGRSWHRDRWMSCFADSWFCIGPVVVVATLAPGPAEMADAAVYALAFCTQIAGDFLWATIRDRVVDRLPHTEQVPFREIWRNYAGVAQFDGMLTPIAFMITLASASARIGLLALAPLVLMLDRFARERHERYGKTLELQRAYRGTVLLLTDVVQFDDSYTAEHSRSVVDLVNAVADELGVDAADRQELEFAAMLHDVGKIAIPKEILNKPAKLDDEEFALMKTHTIEGQYMLDQVGGLLGRVGEIVRSCHERWDGHGYPDGLAGEEIPVAARIVFACDAYNAMTSDRVYRRAMPQEEAVAELTTHAGTQFDPVIVAALIDVVEQSQPELVGSPAEGIRAVLADHSTAGRVEVTA